MKKLLPVILFLVGLLVLGGVYFFVIRDNKSDDVMEEDEIVAEIPQDQKPVVTLTPTEDGHYLNMAITMLDRLNIGAETLDYELLYKTETGFTQGVPGSVNLNGQDVEKDLLLGSESSGKFRYDEGVETGTLTLRFRNDKGKLVGKLSTDWHLQTDPEEITSADGNFKYVLDSQTDGYFVTMETFGLPADAPGPLAAGPYGVFSSVEDEIAGSVTLSGSVYRSTGTDWTEVSSSSDDIGIFIGIN